MKKIIMILLWIALIGSLIKREIDYAILFMLFIVNENIESNKGE